MKETTGSQRYCPLHHTGACSISSPTDTPRLQRMSLQQQGTPGLGTSQPRWDLDQPHSPAPSLQSAASLCSLLEADVGSSPLPGLSKELLWHLVVLIFVLRGAGQAPLPPSPATSTAADGEGCGLWVWGLLLNPTLSTLQSCRGVKNGPLLSGRSCWWGGGS